MRQSVLVLFIFSTVLFACMAPPPTPHLLGVNTTAQPTATVAPLIPSSPNPPAALSPTTQSIAPTVQPATPLPALRASPSPAPTRARAELLQLMDGGCCVSPAWFPDSSSVLFIDKPNAQSPTGMYRVHLNAPNTSELWSERIAFYTREFDYAQIPEPAGTRLIRLSDGHEFRIRNGGRTVSLSPDRTRLLWTETRETFPIENRLSNIMVANLDGSNPQRVTQILRGGGSWLDDNRLLLNGRVSRDTNDSTLFVFNLADGARTEIVRAERMRLTTVSRDGSWIAYAIVNDADATRNGLWVVRTDGTDARRFEMFGAAQWRDGSHLIIAPLEMNAPSHAFYEYDVNTRQTRRLTPEDKPFNISSGDWAISPDGAKIVFVNAADNNLWLWQLDLEPPQSN